MLLSWLAALATAGPAGFYHPADIAAESEAYAQVSKVAQERTAALQERASAVAQGLFRYDLALDLLGETAPEDERAHLDTLQTRFNREMAQNQAFTDVWIEDFDTQFLAALDRALAATEAEARPCAREIAAGRGVPGLPGSTKKNPDCTGEDLNSALADAIDADATLKGELDEILAMSFPGVTLEPAPRPPVVAGDVALHPDIVFQVLAADDLKTIDKADTTARADIEADIALGATPDELEARVAEAQAITARTDAAYAALAEPVLAAIDKRNVKLAKKGQPTVGWCAQPAVFGGCTVGADADAQAALVSDKKVLKTLP